MMKKPIYVSETEYYIFILGMYVHLRKTSFIRKKIRDVLLWDRVRMVFLVALPIQKTRKVQDAHYSQLMLNTKIHVWVESLPSSGFSFCWDCLTYWTSSTDQVRDLLQSLVSPYHTYAPLTYLGRSDEPKTSSRLRRTLRNKFPRLNVSSALIFWDMLLRMKEPHFGMRLQWWRGTDWDNIGRANNFLFFIPCARRPEHLLTYSMSCT